MAIYVTKSGDTWDQIARSELGDQLLVSELLDVNLDLIETVIFPSGVEVNIPETIDETTSKNLPPWKRGDA